MNQRRYLVLKIISALLGSWLMMYAVLVIVFQPSHNRVWELGHEQLPHITYDATSSLVTSKIIETFLGQI